MKKLICLIAAMVACVSALAQTPEEIMARADAEMEARQKNGLSMVIDMKLPLVGTVSTKVLTLNEKSRMETVVAGEKMLTWTDGTTTWTYSEKSKKIEIKAATADDTDNDLSMVDDLEGYDLSIVKETASQWSIRCKKNRQNKDKDAPKTMDIVVDKASNLLVSISAKMYGVTMTIRDIRFGGVSEQQVVFRPSDYPDATISDLR